MADDEQRWRDSHPQGVPVAPPSVSAADRARRMGRGLATGTKATGRGLRTPVSYTHLTLPTNREV